MSRSRGRRGSQAVEFALILPVLLAITGAIVDYGWYYSQYLAFITAVRDAARSGSAYSTADTGACSTATTKVTSGLTSNSVSGTVLHNKATVATSGSDKQITVWVSVDYTPLFGFVPSPDVMQDTVVMRMENSSTVSVCTNGS